MTDDNGELNRSLSRSDELTERLFEEAMSRIQFDYGLSDVGIVPHEALFERGIATLQVAALLIALRSYRGDHEFSEISQRAADAAGVAIMGVYGVPIDDTTEF
jgi:hypothetical protein